MTLTLILWLSLALLLFWALGAYNRLVRLRAQVIGAFAAVDHRLVQVLSLVAERAELQSAQNAACQSVSEDMADNPADAGLDGLRGASIQFEVALRVARKSPLDASCVAALRAARAAMQACWDRSQAAPDDALTANQRAWEDNQQASGEALASFNQQVAIYNCAIAQFPAVVLAYFFGFRAADSL